MPSFLIVIKKISQVVEERERVNEEERKKDGDSS
jgi:hypothetical protein